MGNGAVFAIFQALVTKSEQTGRAQEGAARRPSGGLLVRYRRFPRLDTGHTLFGNRNKSAQSKILHDS
jgi:hypothetical protein